MADPEPLDGTCTDYEQFEHELRAQNCDDSIVATADLDDTAARHLVSDLLDTDTVMPVPGERALVHEPSGTAFDSIKQLAVFHRGWTAARDADNEDK